MIRNTAVRRVEDTKVSEAKSLESRSPLAQQTHDITFSKEKTMMEIRDRE